MRFLFLGLVTLTAACSSRHGSGAAGRTDAGTSDEDCARAMANLTRVMPGVSTDAEEAAYCKRMPRPVVLCLQTARTSAEADACVKRAAAAAPAFRPVGSDEKPETIVRETAASEADCRRALDHLKRVAPAFDGDATLARCVKTATMNDVTCLLAAASVADVRRCGLDPR